MDETRGLTIRQQRPEDAEALHHLYSHPQVIWGTLQLPYPSLQLWQARIADPQPGQTMLVAMHREDLVGHLGLHTHPNRPRRRHTGELGLAVRHDWQRRGVGTALMAAALDLADNWINLRRLELTVFTDNVAAIQLYEKFGFEVEGTLREYAFRDGRYVDVYAMARLRPPLPHAEA